MVSRVDWLNLNRYSPSLNLTLLPVNLDAHCCYLEFSLGVFFYCYLDVIREPIEVYLLNSLALARSLRYLGLNRFLSFARSVATIGCILYEPYFNC